jgi:hypothetical protein
LGLQESSWNPATLQTSQSLGHFPLSSLTGLLALHTTFFFTLAFYFHFILFASTYFTCRVASFINEGRNSSIGTVWRFGVQFNQFLIFNFSSSWDLVPRGPPFPFQNSLSAVIRAWDDVNISRSLGKHWIGMWWFIYDISKPLPWPALSLSRIVNLRQVTYGCLVDESLKDRDVGLRSSHASLANLTERTFVATGHF